MVTGFSHFAPLLVAPFRCGNRGSVRAAPSAKILGKVSPTRSIKRFELLLFILKMKNLLNELMNCNEMGWGRHVEFCMHALLIMKHRRSSCWGQRLAKLHSIDPSSLHPFNFEKSFVIVKHIILPFICPVTAFIYNNDNDPQMSKLSYSLHSLWEGSPRVTLQFKVEVKGDLAELLLETNSTASASWANGLLCTTCH